jgi:hypothetical protein
MRKGMSKEEAKEFYNRLIERQKYKDAPMGRRRFSKGRNRQMHNQDTN